MTPTSKGSPATSQRREVLGRAFFERSPDEVARDLLGAVMVIRSGRAVRRVSIHETEAYGGADDPASHAYRGPTTRSSIMFGEAGRLYVYRSYGIHWCMNVVTERLGTAGAVLLRAGILVTGRGESSATAARTSQLRGPGLLTRELGITGVDNGVDCCLGSPVRVRFERTSACASSQIGVSSRVGISRGQERMSRYFIVGSPAVSKLVGRPSAVAL
ncbi:MAG: DNA-3-methyladenine glycosylase [Acidimicrobiales bacterium]